MLSEQNMEVNQEYYDIITTIAILVYGKAFEQWWRYYEIANEHIY